MIAIDTNILVRLLVDDPGQPEQVHAARTLTQQAGTVHVPTIVLVECVWVLDNAYHFNKSALLTALSHLCGNDAFVLQDLESTIKALEYYREGAADFADYVILVQSLCGNSPCKNIDLLMIECLSSKKSHGIF